MPKLNQIVNGEYIGANKYIIKDIGNGKSTIDFAPDNVFKEGTPVGAEVLNEIQKNGLYQLIGTKTTEGEEDIYDCTLEGIENFEFETINMLLIPDKSSSKANVFIRLAGTKYQIISNTGNSSEVFANQGTGLILKKSTSQAIKWDMSVPVIDNLITSDSKKALSANQGKILKDEVDKIASKEQLGRIKVGKNLIIKEDGTLDGQDVDLTGYYNKSEIDSKFKNLSLVPVPIGGILIMYNTSNPAELYPNTTWELLPDNKFLKTGSTPLQQSGSNSISILKANLPAEKLQIDSFSLTRGTMNITGSFQISDRNSQYDKTGTGCFTTSNGSGLFSTGERSDSSLVTMDASKSWTGSTSSATPYTANMGSGTPITINPEHITTKAWKRLT